MTPLQLYKWHCNTCFSRAIRKKYQLIQTRQTAKFKRLLNLFLHKKLEKNFFNVLTLISEDLIPSNMP